MSEHDRPEQPTTSRRRVLTAMGGLGVGAAAATLLGPASAAVSAASPRPVRHGRATGVAPADCVPLSPEEIEGPYYIDGEQVRSDIVEDRTGVPVTLQLTAQDVSTCTALTGALVAVWHCDGLGYYSGYTANDPDQPPPGDGGHQDPTDNLTFLRGVQQTDDNGAVTFTTIYPGWYYERTIHIHVKVFTGGNVVHTGQLYFDDDLTAQVATQDPYQQHHYRRWTNAEDDIYTSEGGDSSMLTVTWNQPGTIGAGLVAAATLGIDPNAQPQPLPNKA